MSGSRWDSYSRAPLAVRATVALAISLACLLIPALADQWAYAHLYHARLYDRDWAMALRSAGTLYVWIPVALVIWLVQRERDAALAKRRALLAIGSPVLAGLLCEVVKLLIRRERPDVAAGQWVFRAWSDHTFSSAGLATPSSHTMVAFGAATMLARLYPRARWVFYVDRVGVRRDAGALACALPERRDVRGAAGVGGGVGRVDGVGREGDGRWKIEDEGRRTEDRRPRTEDDGRRRRVMKRREFIAAGVAAAGTAACASGFFSGAVS